MLLWLSQIVISSQSKSANKYLYDSPQQRWYLVHVFRGLFGILVVQMYVYINVKTSYVWLEMSMIYIVLYDCVSIKKEGNIEEGEGSC